MRTRLQRRSTSLRIFPLLQGCEVSATIALFSFHSSPEIQSASFCISQRGIGVCLRLRSEWLAWTPLRVVGGERADDDEDSA